MDAIFIDQIGNKKNFLYQYDVGQSFIIENFEYSTAPKVQFSIKSIKTSPSVNSQLSNGNLTVSIPDMLLTYGEDIIAYLYIQDAIKGAVVETVFISVIPRKRPADYQYTSENFARTIEGTTISENFGFADVAKWEDNNPDNEKRYGYFVTASYELNGLVVNKATSIDDVYGVAVEEVGFASNCLEGNLGRSGDLLPKYAYVCTSGFATVIDDGTCVIDGICVPKNDGTATYSSSAVGYRVIDRIDENHIFIFVDPSMRTINNFQTNITNTSSSLNTHINNKSNPHAVTKAQVGLSKVPNVATNDQTPTYTEATTLEKLTSGEKLSIAFGKISKAITDFISHLANKNNPHNVTKKQVGLSNVDNTSDINKPVSTTQAEVIADAKKAGTDAQSSIDAHASRTDNPHTVTKAQVGLDNVDNTSDANKPISTAVQAALDTKPTLIGGKLSKTVLPDDIGSIVVVETIAERDALTPFEGLYVHVKDATGDTTVEAGWADYMYDGETWVKVSSTASSSGGTSEVATIEWANITNKPASYTPKEHTHNELMPFVIGTQTVATNAWSGVVNSIYDGLSIRYWVPQDSTGNVTLNLTLSDGTSTGALNCYTNGSNYLSSDISANTVILLTYRENIILGDSTTVSGWWAIFGSGNYENADIKSY